MYGMELQANLWRGQAFMGKSMTSEFIEEDEHEEVQETKLAAVQTCGRCGGRGVDSTGLYWCACKKDAPPPSLL